MKYIIVVLLCGICISWCIKIMCLDKIKRLKYTAYCEGFFEGSKSREQTTENWAKLLKEAREKAMKYSGRTPTN